MNAYIASVKKIHFFIIILTFTFGYFCYAEFDRQLQIRRLPIIDRALTLISISKNLDTNLEPLHAIDFSKTFIGPMTLLEMTRIRDLNLTPKVDSPENTRYKEDIDFLLSNALIKQSYFVKDVETRTARGLDCRGALFQGSGENGEIMFSLFMLMENFAYNLKSSDLYFFAFSNRCLFPDGHKHSGIIIKQEGESTERLIAIPRTEFFDLTKDRAEQRLSGLQVIRFSADKFLPHLPKSITHLPVSNKKLLDFSGDYVVISETMIDDMIFDELLFRTGVYYKRTSFNRAVDELFKVPEFKTSVFGLQASHWYLIDTAPMILFLALYVMYRRLKAISRCNSSVSEPWLFREIDTRLDKAIMYLWMTSPIFCTLAIFGGFAAVNGLTIRWLPWNIWHILGVDSTPMLRGPSAMYVFLANIYFMFFLWSLALLAYIEYSIWRVIQSQSSIAPLSISIRERWLSFKSMYQRWRNRR